MTTPSPKHSPGSKRRFPNHSLALLATFVLALTIAGLALSPPDPEQGGSDWDKFKHFIAFAALVFPCALLYARALVWVVPAAILYGGAIEIIQPYVGRNGEGADVVADILGIAFGVAIGLSLRGFLARRALTRAATDV